MELERIGGREYECDCGAVHRLASSIARRRPSELSEDIRRILPYGKALIVSDESTWLRYGDSLTDALAGAPLEFSRYLAGKGQSASDFAELFHFPEDVRCVVVLGADALPAAKYFCTLRDVPYLVIPVSPAGEEIFSPYVRVRVNGVSRAYPAKLPAEAALTEFCLRPDARAVAASYGRIMSKFVSLIDYRVQCICTGLSLCRGCYDLAREAVSDALGLTAASTLAECAETLLAAELKLSAVSAYLGGYAVNYGGESCMAVLLPERGLRYGDRAFAAACKLLRVYRLFFSNEIPLSLAVPDVSGRIERAARLSGISERELAERAKVARPRDNKQRLGLLKKFAPAFSEELEGVLALLPAIRDTYRALGGKALETYGEAEYRAAFFSAPELAERYNTLVFLRDTGLMELIRTETNEG